MAGAARLVSNKNGSNLELTAWLRSSLAPPPLPPPPVALSRQRTYSASFIFIDGRGEPRRRVGQIVLSGGWRERVRARRLAS
jgi:hypothetical protein